MRGTFKKKKKKNPQSLRRSNGNVGKHDWKMILKNFAFLYLHRFEFETVMLSR